MQSAPFRPMSITDIIDAAFRLYRNHFGLFVGIVALLQLPLILMQVGGTFAMAQPFADLILALEDPTLLGDANFALPVNVSIALVFAVIAVIVFILVQAIFVQNMITAAVVHAAAASSHGTPVSVGGAYRTAISHLLTMIVTNIMTGIIVGLFSVLLFVLPLGLLVFGALTLGFSSGNLDGAGSTFAAFSLVIVFFVLLLIIIVLSLVLSLIFTFTTQSIVIEQRGVFAALRRSYELVLVRGSLWRVLGMVLLVGLLVFLLQLIPSVAVQAIIGLAFSAPEQVLLQQSLNTAWSYTMQILTYPFQLIVLTLLYYDIRVRTEGYDLELRSSDTGSRASSNSPAEARNEDPQVQP